MPTTFPTLRSGSFRFPLTRTKAYKTGVLRFVNGSEQRWKSVTKLEPFVLEYRNLHGYDLSILREFFRSAKGAYTTDIELTINGTTYSNLALDQDDFTPTQTGPNKFSITFRLKQTKV